MNPRQSERERCRQSRDWKQIERTVHRPGEWRQTPKGWEKVPTE